MGRRLEVRNLSHSYPDRTTGEPTLLVLQDVSFQLDPGEIVSVIGPSGCGKTTLLNLIAAFVRTQVGSITIDDLSLEKPSRACVLISQEQTVFPWKTVLGNAAFGLKAKGLPKREQVGRAKEYLEIVNLSDWIHQYPAQLSGGMIQRLALARALAVEPKLILMDEPFASLDWQARRHLQDQVSHIFESSKQTVLIATHDIEEAIYLADRVLILSSRPGTIVNTLQVPLSRPRDPRQRYESTFLSIQKTILRQLEYAK